jgi:hypothetical protein
MLRILAIAAAALTVCVSATLGTRPAGFEPLHYVFHSIPLPGHLNPLLAQAEALVLKGHRATIATAASARAYVVKHKHPEYVIRCLLLQVYSYADFHAASPLRSFTYLWSTPLSPAAECSCWSPVSAKSPLRRTRP